MLNWDRVGLIVFFFIPALWQGRSANPTLFSQKPWDACEKFSVRNEGKFSKGRAGSPLHAARGRWGGCWHASSRPRPQSCHAFHLGLVLFVGVIGACANGI